MNVESIPFNHDGNIPDIATAFCDAFQEFRTYAHRQRPKHPANWLSDTHRDVTVHGGNFIPSTLDAGGVLDHHFFAKHNNGARVIVSQPYLSEEIIREMYNRDAAGAGIVVAIFGSEVSWYCPGSTNLVVVWHNRYHEHIEPLIESAAIDIDAQPVILNW